MEKIAVAVVGYGNVGRACKRAIEECPDLILSGVVRRPATVGDDEPELRNTHVAVDIRELPIKSDVALLCVPSRELPIKLQEYQELGVCTVDSFDERAKIIQLKQEADVNAKIHKVTSIIASGWDPGTDSAVRAMMKIAAITGQTTTTYGGEKGGRSMGHTALVKSIAGVKNAVVLTYAVGRGKQRRTAFIEVEKGADVPAIEKTIQADAYFLGVPVTVQVVPSIDKYNTLRQEVSIERSAIDVKQRYDLSGINPEFTANIMTSCARAAIIARDKGDFGAFTFIERPLIDYISGADVYEKLAKY